MLMTKLIKVAQYERALVYRDRNLEAVLAPGKHRVKRGKLEVQVYDVSEAELDLPRVDVLISESRALLEPYVQIVELGDREVGLVYKNERLHGVLAPGSRVLYWRGPVKVRVDVRDISSEYALDASTARVLMRGIGTAGLANILGVAEVPDTSVGLLIVDGELREVLKPGATAYWKYGRNVKVEMQSSYTNKSRIVIEIGRAHV